MSEEAEYSPSKIEGHSPHETDALAILAAMEQDTSLCSNDDIKQDIAQDPLGDVKSVYVPEERAVSLCVPKIEVSSGDPPGDVERVYISEVKAVPLCAPKIEVSSEDPHHELYGVHQLTQINKSEEIIFVAPKIEPFSPLTPAAEEDEDKAELSPGCSETLPNSCLKGEIGQQAVLVSQTLSVHLTGEPETPDDPPGGEVGLNSNSFLSLNTDTEQTFQCAICNKEFARKKALRRHLPIHLRKFHFSCQICLKKFTARSTLKSHFAIHTGERERKFQCRICYRKFVRRSSLNMHLSIIHQGQKNYSCPGCSLKFSRHGDYRRHLQTHTGSERNFQCPTCHKLFTRSSNLKIHLLAHSGEKNFECQTCSKASLRAGDLKRHINLHTGEKNYECSICHRKFAQRCNLNTHYLTHERKSGKGTKSV